MMELDAFDVVKVPFPFTDKTAAKNRPALVLSSARHFNRDAGHSVMAMITSAAHIPWPLDYAILDLEAAGLPAPSLIRFKLFTLDHRLVRATLGRLAKADQLAVRDQLRRLLPDN
jgi:mRNA interferase MazF